MRETSLEAWERIKTSGVLAKRLAISVQIVAEHAYPLGYTSAPELVELESVAELRVDDRPAAAQAFWARAALVRGADPATVIGEGGSFTALPAS